MPPEPLVFRVISQGAATPAHPHQENDHGSTVKEAHYDIYS